MEQPINLRNGYIQPDFNPNKKDKSVIISLIITMIAFTIYQTCIL